MEFNSATLFIPIGAVVAALIAGFFSFLNLVISKEQKVSEFRQQWIDGLRDELSTYIASVRFLSLSNRMWIKGGSKDPGKHYAAMESVVLSAGRASCSIRLRVNPNDTDEEIKGDNDAFLQALHSVNDHLEKWQFEDAREEAGRLVAKMQPILKYEWERVKKGGRIYESSLKTAQVVLWSSVVLLFGIIVVGGIYSIYQNEQKAGGTHTEAPLLDAGAEEESAGD